MSSLFVSDLMTSRRDALMGLGGAAIAGTVGLMLPQTASAQNGKLNLGDPKDNLYAFGKIWGGYGEPVIGGYHGMMYGRISNKRMIPVFGYAGTGVTLCEYDPEGFLSIRSRETAFFTDLRTGEVLETWDNPFTEETVEVYHFYNHMNAGRIGTQMPRFDLGTKDDVPTLMNEGTVFPDENGEVPFLMPFQRFGDDLLLEWDYTHDYTNPVKPEGWPKASVGPRISPSEHFTFNMNYDQLVDRDVPSSRFIAGFARQSNFWPWMRMGGSGFEDGILFARMFSHKGLQGTGDVFPQVLAYMEKHAPEFLELPDDMTEHAKRLDVTKAYVQDIPPENPDYEWVEKRPEHISAPPTGLGSRV